MKTNRIVIAVFTLIAVGLIAGCWGNSTKSPDVADSIHKSLDQAGLKSVSVSQDRDKGVVTLGGQVSTGSEKAQAESIANSMAGGQVVADQIAVIPPGQATEVKAMIADLDQGIEKNLDAALIQNNMHNTVSYKVKNGVVTLTGEVISEDQRTNAGSVAIGVPNVHQVVNDLQIKNRKASSSM
jgi:hyperosmotically inducible protein